jgi:hypothetical protein
LTRKRLALFGALAILAAAGAAYATIPDSSGVYTACELKAAGTIRLIDPSLGSSSLLGHCTALEAQVTWNQRGQSGISPTVAQLSTGDSHCPAGGASLTDASGNVAYVCSGHDGTDGQSFTGSFTSPNGQFSLDVADGGVTITGPSSAISLSPTGDLAITAANATETISGDATRTVGHDESEHVKHNRGVKVDVNETITVGGARTETISGDDSLKVNSDRSEVVSGDETIRGTHVAINGVSTCAPAGRVGDLVDSAHILTGSATVCIGG